MASAKTFKMSSSVLVILVVLLISAALVSSRIHQTEDSIIVEGMISEILKINYVASSFASLRKAL